MKKTALFIGIAVLLVFCLPAFAQEFPDVPADQWAYAAVQQLADAGIIVGYPDGTFGGKRAMTRYEFAEALAKAMPVIIEKVKEGIVIPPSTTTTVVQPQAAQTGITKEQFDALQKLVNGFQKELASLGVDVEALRRDLSALNERLTAVEKEQERVRFWGQANVIARGEVNTLFVHDRDGRGLAEFGDDDANLLSNSAVFNDLQFGVTAKVGNDVKVHALFATNNYLRWALVPVWDAPDESLGDFTLWNMYVTAPMKLGGLGPAKVTAGRFPFQLTPLTLKSIDPDSYSSVTKLDSGDFVIDGGKVAFDFGKVNLVAFAAKGFDVVNDQYIINELWTPTLSVWDDTEDIVNLGGARAMIDLGAQNKLGLTYEQFGLWDDGRAQVIGGDLNLKFGNFGVWGEYAQSDTNDAVKNWYSTDFSTLNNAWNANIGWKSGDFKVAGGYSETALRFMSPGYWSRLGRAVNMRNLKGANANVSWAFNDKFSLCAEGQWLTPLNDFYPVVGREVLEPDGHEVMVWPDDTLGGNFKNINYWNASLKYAFDANNAFKVGWEQVNWNVADGDDPTREVYIDLAFDHALSPSSSLKVMYQIINYTQGDIEPYDDQDDNGRGGVATAQFQVNY